MCYLYGTKFVYEHAESDPTIAALRQELYTSDYASIPWNSTRHFVADVDNYSPVNPLMLISQNFLRNVWEAVGGPVLRFYRTKGLHFAAAYMDAEDLQTNFVDIGPVNKALNMCCCYARGKKEQFAKHLLRVPDYLWVPHARDEITPTTSSRGGGDQVAEDGMKMQGYNGSQCWDTSFAIQVGATIEQRRRRPRGFAHPRGC
jgi:hypothetical protein